MLNTAAGRIRAFLALARRYPRAALVFSGGDPGLFGSEVTEARGGATIVVENWGSRPSAHSLQQRLVTEAGWTPVVGFDLRVGPPKRVLPSSIVFDFNNSLGLPILYPHFPLEFSFLFCERIAFRHSDLLIKRTKTSGLTNLFETLADGQTAATWVDSGLRYRFTERRNRYWELIGCTTRGASRDQFEKGCGWWMAFWAHPNQQNDQYIRRRFYWDRWRRNLLLARARQRKCRGDPRIGLQRGHFTKIGNKAYVRTRELGEQMCSGKCLKKSCAFPTSRRHVQS